MKMQGKKTHRLTRSEDWDAKNVDLSVSNLSGFLYELSLDILRNTYVATKSEGVYLPCHSIVISTKKLKPNATTTNLFRNASDNPRQPSQNYHRSTDAKLNFIQDGPGQNKLSLASCEDYKFPNFTKSTEILIKSRGASVFRHVCMGKRAITHPVKRKDAWSHFRHILLPTC